MEITQPIAKYYYTYGASQEVNRSIEFSRSVGDDPTSLTAQVKGNLDGKWLLTTLLSRNDIKVEKYSTTEKARLLMDARQKGTSTPSFEKKTIDQFNIEEQNNILTSLEPNGPRKLEIENTHGDQHGLETVKRITIFDPS